MKCKKWMTVCFLGIVIFFFVCNVGLVTGSVEEYCAQKISFAEFKGEVQSELTSDRFSFKDFFVNLNSLVSRLSGKSIINDVAFVDEGILIDARVPYMDMEAHGEKLAQFDAELKQLNIPFVYVQAPSEVDLEGKLIPVGAVNLDNENTDRLLAELEARNVEYMDLRPQFSANIEDIIENFYKTDHHWNYTAAFKAFNLLNSMIQKKLGDETDVSPYTNIENWEKRVFSDAFSGSRAARVGTWVTKNDDFEYYLPKFETDMKITYVQEQIECSGTFSECIIQDRWDWPTYTMYLGQDSSWVKHRNNLPAIKKKILLLRDSFGFPLQAYFSTVYEAVDVIDPRMPHSKSMIEYVREIRPDIVIMLHNATQIERIADYDFVNNEN